MEHLIGIGELSRRTRCRVVTIRYYEQVGLMPMPRREPGGRFRRYGADDIARLRFIHRARQFTFTTAEIRKLLRLAPADRENARVEVRSLVGTRLAEVRNRISDLQTIERSLDDAMRECEAGHPQGCPIMGLFGDAGEV